MHSRRKTLSKSIWGPLAKEASLGSDGAWEAFVGDGWFNLRNRENFDAARFYFTQAETVKPGQMRTVSVLLAIRADGRGNSIAGLLFDGKGDLNLDGKRAYAVFAVGADGRAHIYQVHKNGKIDNNEHTKARARLDGSDVLEIRETATGAKAYMNGESLFTITNDNGLGPIYGIYAGGVGRMGFTGFRIIDTQAEQPFDPAAFLVGNWQVDPFSYTTSGGSTVNVEFSGLTVRPNGTFSFTMSGTLSKPGEGSAARLEISQQGPFTASGDMQNGIKLKSDAPARYRITYKDGRPPREFEDSGGASFQIIDHDTMRSKDGATYRRL